MASPSSKTSSTGTPPSRPTIVWLAAGGGVEKRAVEDERRLALVVATLEHARRELAAVGVPW